MILVKHEPTLRKKVARIAVLAGTTFILFGGSSPAFAAWGHNPDEYGTPNPLITQGTLNSSQTLPDESSTGDSDLSSTQAPTFSMGAIANSEANGSLGDSGGITDFSVSIIEKIAPPTPGPGGGEEIDNNGNGSNTTNKYLPQTNESREGYLLILGAVLLGAAYMLRRKQRKLQFR